MTQTKKTFCEELAGEPDLLGERYKDAEDFVRQAVTYYNDRWRGLKDNINRTRGSMTWQVGWQIHLIVYLLIIYLIKLIIK